MWRDAIHVERTLRFHFRPADRRHWCENLLAHWTDDCICIDCFGLNQTENGQANVLHVLGKVYSQLLPGREGFATKFTRLILWSLRCLVVALFQHDPGGFR